MAPIVRAVIWIGCRALRWDRKTKLLLAVVLDSFLILASSWAAFALRLGEWSPFFWPIQRFMITMLIAWLAVASFLKIYNSLFRYVGRGEIAALAAAVCLTFIPLFYLYSITSYPGVPRTIPVIVSALFFLLLISSRIVGRYVLVDLGQASAEVEQPRKVLIYGAGVAGEQLALSLRNEQGMTLVGFVDDDPAKIGRRLTRVPIHSGETFIELIQSLDVTDVMIAIPRLEEGKRGVILDSVKKLGINVQILPAVRDFFDGRITASALRPIQIEDLLGRDPVKPIQHLLRSSVSDKVVLITGAGGSIGSELCRQVLALDPLSIVLADSNELGLFSIGIELENALEEKGGGLKPAIFRKLIDLTNTSAVMKLFADFRPDTIYHAAAYKHVPLVEENVAVAVNNNIKSMTAVANAAVKFDAERFILISTDKAVRPPNVMGASKRFCEMILQDMASRMGSQGPIMAMVRFGNVLGSSGSVVPSFSKQIAAGGPVTVTHREVTRFFMTIPEAAQLVIQAGSLARGGEVYLLDMGEPVKIWDLAKTMIQLAGRQAVEDPGLELRESSDIRIVETGLRPGEKLYEELLLSNTPIPTCHPRILEARETHPEAAELEAALAEIYAAIEANDERACRFALQALVPTLR